MPEVLETAEEVRPLLAIEWRAGELLYRQIAEYFRGAIQRGEYPDGAHLPSCQKVARALRVSAQTVDTAYNQLVSEGLVFRRRSVGTIVHLGAESLPPERRSRTQRQIQLPICQMVRMPARDACPGEGDLFFDYQSGFAEGFNAWNYRFEIVYLRDGQSDLELARMLVEERQMRGLISQAISDEANEYLIASGFPVVFLRKDFSGRGMTCVDCDIIRGYREAWEFADRLGHRKAAYLGTGDDHVMGGEHRYYQCASARELARARCALGARLIISMDADVSMIEGQLIREFGPWRSKGANWPTLIFAQSDFMATRLLCALRNLGIRAPEDISVIGCNDAPIAQQWEPQLTTLEIPRYQMALASTRLLLDLIEKRPGAQGRLQIFPARLIQRMSAGQAKKP